jgi:putative FmdB family regulatory protein
MPIYEYQCNDCDRPFETLVRRGHDDDAQCPSCNGVRISRRMSVFASARAAAGDAIPNGIGDSTMRAGGGCCGGSCGCH